MKTKVQKIADTCTEVIRNAGGEWVSTSILAEKVGANAATVRHALKLFGDSSKIQHYMATKRMYVWRWIEGREDIEIDPGDPVFKQLSRDQAVRLGRIRKDNKSRKTHKYASPTKPASKDSLEVHPDYPLIDGLAVALGQKEQYRQFLLDLRNNIDKLLGAE